MERSSLDEPACSLLDEWFLQQVGRSLPRSFLKFKMNVLGCPLSPTRPASILQHQLPSPPLVVLRIRGMLKLRASKGPFTQDEACAIPRRFALYWPWRSRQSFPNNLTGILSSHLIVVPPFGQQ